MRGGVLNMELFKKLFGGRENDDNTKPKTPSWDDITTISIHTLKIENRYYDENDNSIIRLKIYRFELHILECKTNHNRSAILKDVVTKKIINITSMANENSPSYIDQYMVIRYIAAYIDSFIHTLDMFNADKNKEYFHIISPYQLKPEFIATIKDKDIRSNIYGWGYDCIKHNNIPLDNCHTVFRSDTMTQKEIEKLNVEDFIITRVSYSTDHVSIFMN